MSLTSFAIEDVAVAGVDASCEMTEAAMTPLEVVSSEEDNEEDGLDEDGIDVAAVALLGAWVGGAKEGIVVSEMGACSGSTDATLRADS